MKTYPFAIVVTVDADRPMATHIPIEIREHNGKIYALGHIAYGNPHKKTLATPAPVLLIFQGPHTYISSSWYEAENVPTWDYLAVHAYGTSRLMAGAERETYFASLLRRYESHREKGRLWETYTEGFLQDQMQGIVAFEIEITAIHGAGKLSQNRNDRDYQAIVSALENLSDEDAHRVAQWMRHHRPHVF